ncbi:MAG: hypothetical protein JKY48_13310 [Flavobacteriales bacterium]|nr:hypothetical protein [Flavobacteriales bacterium]
MKKLLFTLAITLGALATYAQATKLTVNNTSATTIMVTVSVANSSCTPITSSPSAIPVLAGASAIISPLTSNGSDYWYAVRATTVVTGTVLTTAPNSITTFNQCAPLPCTPPSDILNGLNAIWTMPCNDEVTIF